MIIIETCPKCGYDLVDEMICTMPPIPKKVCYNCGWSWTGEQEEVVRVPFGEKFIKPLKVVTVPMQYDGRDGGLMWDKINEIIDFINK